MTSYSNDGMTMEKYRESIQFRMCSILSAYRRLACLVGVAFSEQMREYYSKNKKEKNFAFDKNFLTLVDGGFIILSEPEVKMYAKYICEAYGYNFDEFYILLRDEAGDLKITDDTKKNNRALAEAMVSITMCLNSCDKGD